MGNLSLGGLKLFHALLQTPAAAECLKPADSPQSASKLSRSKVMRLKESPDLGLSPVSIIPKFVIGCQF